MNPIATCAAQLMEAHPHPALRLGELLEPVAERIDRSLTCARLRSSLAEHPEAFRLLNPWQGPWRLPDLPVTDPAADVWVVLLSPPRDHAQGPQPARTLRESVRWLAHGIDPRSPLSVSRWYAIALAERESRRALARRCA